LLISSEQARIEILYRIDLLNRRNSGMLAQQQELLAFGLREKLQLHRRTRSDFLSSRDFRNLP